MIVALAMMLLLLVWAVPASAATGTLYTAGNLILSEGVVFLPGNQGSHSWEGDHGLCVCRLDSAPTDSAAPFQVNQAICNTAALAPDQMAFAQME